MNQSEVDIRFAEANAATMRRLNLIASLRSGPVRAITVCQPHAWGIVHGDKRYENRTWPSSYRGALLIHAGKSRKWLGQRYPGQPPDNWLRFGYIIGVVRMVDCLPADDADDTPCREGPWCHEYRDKLPLPEPIECTGKQGLWRPNADLMAKVLVGLTRGHA